MIKPQPTGSNHSGVLCGLGSSRFVFQQTNVCRGYLQGLDNVGFLLSSSEPTADIRIRIRAIVIRILTLRTAIRAIIPITACKE